MPLAGMLEARFTNEQEGELRAVVGLASDGSPFIQFLDEHKDPTWTTR